MISYKGITETSETEGAYRATVISDVFMPQKSVPDS